MVGCDSTESRKSSKKVLKQREEFERLKREETQTFCPDCNGRLFRRFGDILVCYMCYKQIKIGD
jgi:uncharacterized protein (DUF983 family)